MKKLFNVHLIIPFLFFTSIYSSFIGYIFKFDLDMDIAENRTYSRVPALTFKYDDLISYPNKFEQNFNDHFGFRKSYIHLNSYLKYKIFGISSSPKVIVGKANWLFYEYTRPNYRDSSILTTDHLIRWRLASEIKQTYLEQYGIPYYFVVIPNKNSIYPEYMPDSVPRITKDTPVDRMSTYMRTNSNVNFLSAKHCLLKGKDDSYPSFYRTDTHINYFGAFLIAQAIMEIISPQFPNLTPPVLSDFNTTSYKSHGGDLARMLTLQNTISDDWIFFNHKNQWTFKNESNSVIINPDFIFIKEGHSPHIETSHPNKNLPKAIMFRDSCSNALIPFLSEKFSYIKYLWENLEYRTELTNILTDYEPDIFIEEIVERNLINLPASIPKDISKYIFNKTSDVETVLDAKKCAYIFAKDTFLSDVDYFIPLSDNQEAIPGCLVLKLIINVSESSVLTISYLTENTHKYSVQNTCSISLDKGVNEEFIVLLSDTITGELKINFSQNDIIFDFKLIEIKKIVNL